MQIDDDRVFCPNCLNFKQVKQRSSWPVEVFEKFRKVNARPLRWMFKEAKISNGWASVTWDERQCSKTGLLAIPSDIPHRCHLFKPTNQELDNE